LTRLSKELEDKDEKYIQLMERLRQTQDQFKHYQMSKEEEMMDFMDFISKEDHKKNLMK